MRMRSVSRAQQRETTSSVVEKADFFVEAEVEQTVLPDYAKHKVTAEETNIEEFTNQNVQNRNPNVGTSEDSGRSVSPAAGDEKCKSFW